MLDGARLLFMINQLTIILVSLLITRRAGGSPLALVVVAFALLANSFFLHQGFRIRSDLLAASFCLFSLLAILSHRGVVAAILLALGFMATPKTILLWPAFFILAIALDRRHFSWKAFGGILVGFALLNHQALRDAAQFFFREFQTEQLGFSYWDSRRWHYVFIFLKDNPIWVFLTVCSLALLLKPSKLPVQQKALLLFGLSAVFALAIHPEKLPFFIASYAPYFAICIGIAFTRIELFISQQTPRLSVAFVLVMLITSGAIATSSAEYIHDLSNRRANSQQRKTIDTIYEHWSQVPSLRYYDGVGLIVREDLPSFFVGPGQLETNASAGEFLKRSEFDVILITDKVRLIGHENFKFITDHYVDLGSGFFARSINMKSSAQRPPSGREILRELQKKQSGVFSARSQLSFHHQNEEGTILSSEGNGMTPDKLLDKNFQLNPPETTTITRMTLTSSPGVFSDHLSKIFSFDSDIGR